MIYFTLFIIISCQKKTVTYTSHSAFDFLTTPTCCIWCAARLNWGVDLAVGGELSALHLIAFSIGL